MRAIRCGFLMVGVASLAGCAAEPAVTVVSPTPEPLPVVRVEQVVGMPGVAADPGAEIAADGSPNRVTLTAAGADLRALLVGLADAAGVSLIVAPEVAGRVTVHFEDVPAEEALGRLIAESGLMVARPFAAPWGPTVFYVVPVNVNEADAATIQARFRVSAELARFLVQSRVPPS